MKAGGAYVPIDPAYPNERIVYILNDTNCKVALTDQANHQLMQTLAHGISLVVVGDEQVWEMEFTAPVVDLAANNLAYVIYTSGSTGTPKGVMVTHQNVLRLFFNDTNLFNFGANDVWAFFHSFCFDVSVWEMFGCLLFGSKLVIVPKQVAQNASVFGKMLVDDQITMLHQTPSAFNILQLHLLATPTPLALKYIIFAGEALNPKQLNTWKQTYPACKLVNMYGITEVGVYNT
ncbi:MAG: type I polyketide synthase, partial [Pedobacter sp.]